MEILLPEYGQVLQSVWVYLLAILDARFSWQWRDPLLYSELQRRVD
jgi:hypothetical protein